MENVTASRSVLNYKGDLDYINQWLMMESPTPVFIIWATYLMFVLKIGPKYMKNRTPFNLKNVLLIYNVIQVIASGYICYLGCKVMLSHGLYAKYKFGREDTLEYVTTLHYFLIAKTVELLDTVFFVLRKKDRQITFLHIYHHSYMVLSVWFTLKYEPSYITIFPGALNSLIHVFMYTYYALSAFPNMVQYLWWKRYLTTMQLIQFLLIVSHVSIGMMVSVQPPSRILVYQLCSNVILFIFLFTDFYIKSYWKKKSVEVHTKKVE